MNRYLVIAGAALVAASVAPKVGAAQSTQSDQWLAWQGCWHAEGDETTNLLCVVPEGLGVRMVSLVAGVVQSESRIVADGQPRQVNQEGCQGTERADWSTDKTRLFLHSDQTCGAGITRKVSGIISMISPSRWVTVQSVTSGNTQAAARVIQYTAVEPTNLPDFVSQALRGNRLARETARVAASSRVELSDVREAVGKVESGVVENWVTATNQTFDVDAKKLVNLADNGVPANVIDALVAVSNPRHFEIRTGAPATLNEPENNRRDGRRNAYDCDPMYSWWDYSYSGYCSRYNRYGGYYGYSPYGYDYYRWGSNGTPIIIVRGDNDGDGQVSNAKATKRGYTRGSSNSSGSSSSSGKSSVSSSGSSSTSGSSGSSSGSSSSGSSTTTTRTAKPRGGS